MSMQMTTTDTSTEGEFALNVPKKKKNRETKQPLTRTKQTKTCWEFLLAKAIEEFHH